MLNFYYGYHFLGMHLVWWFLWLILLIWLFATPYNLPGRRVRKDVPIDILKKRFASGEITKEDYLEKKKILEE